MPLVGFINSKFYKIKDLVLLNCQSYIMRDPSFMNELFLSLYSSQEDEDDGLAQKLIRHYLPPIFFFLPTIDLGHPICLLSYTEKIRHL